MIPNGDDYTAIENEYARLAHDYDRRWRHYVDASVAATVRRLTLTPGEAVLDVGCGTGVLLERLRTTAPQTKLAGVDLSGAMLAVARGRLGGEADLRRARAEALPFADACFDVVTSTSVLHFIADPLAALGQMRRILKPAGRLVITDWCHDYLSCKLFDLVLRAGNAAHRGTYGSRRCRELVARSGFSGIAVERYKIDWLWGLMTVTATKPGPNR